MVRSDKPVEKTSTTVHSKPPRMLLAYCMTGGETHVRRIARSLTEQARLNGAMNESPPFPRVLVTDANIGSLPDIVQQAFRDRLVQCDPFVHEQSSGRKHFCLSKFRNASIDYAVANGFDWLMLCDCDTIIAGGADLELPQSGFCFPKVYWQKHAEESAVESLATIRAGGEDVFSRGNSWFILSAALIKRLRFNENIYGYGFEDNEFQIRAAATGYSLQQANLIVIHSFHPDEEKNIDRRMWNRNKDIFEATRLLISMYKDVTRPRNLLLVDARHPHWTSKLILDQDTKLLIHAQHKSEASYEIVDDILRVKWGTYPEEIFAREGGFFVYRQTAGGAAEGRREAEILNQGPGPASMARPAPRGSEVKELKPPVDPARNTGLNTRSARFRSGPVIVQTSDPDDYFDMLVLSSGTTREFCRRQHVSYESWVGIKWGNASWHAVYNRIFLFKEFSTRRFRGWAIYLDADAYIADLDFPLPEYLREKSEYAAILTKPDTQKFSTAVMLLNFALPTAHLIAELWLRRFQPVFEKLPLGETRSEAEDPAMLFNSLVAESPGLLAEIHVESAELLNSPGARFVRHRPHQLSVSLSERTQAVAREVGEVLAGALARVSAAA